MTHSHFDHIAGLFLFKEKFNPPIISSKSCSEKIVNPKKNLSAFSDFDEVIAPKSDIFIDEQNIFSWNGFKVVAYQTPGHSDCSICILIDNKLFTGDTLLYGIRSLVVKPGGNKNLLNESIKFIYENFDKNTIIYPGHGKEFKLGNQNITIAL